MLLPSGDHFGPLLRAAAVVSCRCCLPSVESSQICVLASPESRSYSVTSTAAHFPSGATDGAPTRLIFQRSSAVMPRFSAAASGAQIRNAQHRNSNRMKASGLEKDDVILWMDWARRDSNPHAFRHRILSPARLPVTPLARRVDSIIGRIPGHFGSALTTAAGNSY